MSAPEPPPPTFDAAGEAKRLLRVIRSGGLATLAPDGFPFASLVAVATMPDGSPILLLSQLAAHTHHLEADGRCSLLLAESGKGDALAHPRLSISGRAVVAADDIATTARRRFLARNPKAKLYADFTDFSFWVLAIEAGHLNGGFARAASLTAMDLLTETAACADLIEGEAAALAHMTADHADAVRLYATRLLGFADGDWRLTGLDPEGLDLICCDRTARLAFPHPIATLGELRGTLVRLATEARVSKS